ncbi:MAG TPA: hypothetical protein VI790_02895 [Candidatus Nanoarchaeia archaeon]|nr:hypothetical protein [Candidatus Nanoarchaeia archaeon]
MNEEELKKDSKKIIDESIKASGLDNVKVLLYYYNTKVAYELIGKGGDLEYEKTSFLKNLIECSDEIKSTDWHLTIKNYNVYLMYIQCEDETTRGKYQRFTPVAIIKNPLENIETITNKYDKDPLLSEHIKDEIRKHSETKNKINKLAYELENRLMKYI